MRATLKSPKSPFPPLPPCCLQKFERGEKTPHPQDFSLTKKTARFIKGRFLSLLRTENGLTTDIFVVKYTGSGLAVKRPGVLSKVQMLNLVLGVGVFSLLPKNLVTETAARSHPAGKGVRQKEFGKKATKKVTGCIRKSDQKVAETDPKTKKLIELLLRTSSSYVRGKTKGQQLKGKTVS